MNCETFQQLTAWPCRGARDAYGQEITVLAPPVPFWDGSTIPVYVLDRGEQVELTDDGGVIHHLDSSGFDLGSDRRKRKGIERAVAKWNVVLDTELQILCSKKDLAFALQRYMCALFEVAHWEADNSGKAIDTGLLIAEAESYIRILQPNSKFDHDVKLFGISERPVTFPLKVDATYFDAMGPHPASSAAVVKRLFDVRSYRENKDTDITVIVEDRGDVDRVKSDIQIVTQLAHVSRLSHLRASALAIRGGTDEA